MCFALSKFDLEAPHRATQHSQHGRNTCAPSPRAVLKCLLEQSANMKAPGFGFCPTPIT